MTWRLGLCHAFDRNLLGQLQNKDKVEVKAEVEGAEDISPRCYFKD
jgi:hypothetical protein